MTYFGYSAYDPLEGSSTSIDPLNSLSTSVRLADYVFPGSSGRIWKIRYLSALCFLIKAAGTNEKNDFKTNYLLFRKYENIFILTSALYKKLSDPEEAVGLIGTSKAARLIENSSRNFVDITDEILSNQGNLGPLGIHLVLLRSLGLVNEENLILSNSGNNLADLYKGNLSDLAKVIEDLGQKNRVDLNKLENNIKPESFSFNLLLKQNEADALYLNLIENPQRAQLMKDIKINQLNQSIDSDDAYVKILADINDSENATYYKLIFHFEMFQRKLHTYFNHFLLDPTPKSLNDHKVAKEYLEKQSSEFKFHGEEFKKLVNSLKGEEINDFKRFLEIIDNLLPKINHFEEFTHTLIKEQHGKHQSYKNKSCWVFYEKDLIAANRKNARSERSLKEERIHRFRYANAQFILRDLGKLGKR